MAAANKKTDYEDDQQLLETFSKLFNDQLNIATQILERTWFRNILYYMGEQWFEWAKSQNTFKKIIPQVFTPTPVCNIIRDHVRSIKALILNKEYSVRVWPNSNDQDDRDAAELGENFLRWLETRRDEDEIDEKEMTSIWMTLCGVGFDRTFPSTADDGWVFDASGNPVKTGDVVVDSVSPFMMRMDTQGRKLNQKRMVGMKSLKPKEWVEDTFKVKISGTRDNPGAVDYERRLMHLVANVSPWKGEGIEMPVDAMADEDMVIFKELEFRPSKEHPRGRYVISCDDQIIKKYERMVVPVDPNSNVWYYSWTDYHYNYVPGRYWSDPSMNDLISPQNTINQIDQDLEINRRGVGSPWVLVSTDLNVERVSKYGQKLLVLKYDPFLSGGQKPEIHDGTPLPQQVLEERNIHRMAAQDSAGDPKNVLRGNAPSAQASGIMVDILRDAAEQGHLPDINRFYRALKRRKRKQLILAREVYTEERMIKIPDRYLTAKVIRFKGVDLRDNTDVRLEISGGMASTRTGQTQLLLKLTEAGFFSAASDLDPEHREELLRRLGLTSFRDKRNVDVERATYENNLLAVARAEDMVPAPLTDPASGEPIEVDGQTIEVVILPGLFLAMGNPQDPENGIVLSDDPMFKYDNHQIHYETHRRFILSSEFRALAPEVQEFAMAHSDIHKAMIDVQAAEAAQKAGVISDYAAGMSGNGGQPAGGPAGPGAPGPAEGMPDIVPSGSPEQQNIVV